MCVWDEVNYFRRWVVKLLINLWKIYMCISCVILCVCVCTIITTNLSCVCKICRRCVCVCVGNNAQYYHNVMRQNRSEYKRSLIIMMDIIYDYYNREWNGNKSTHTHTLCLQNNAMNSNIYRLYE